MQKPGGVKEAMYPLEQLRHWFGQDPDLGRKALLQLAADETGGRMFHIDRPADIGVAFAAILEAFRERYVLTYVPRGVAKAGWHPIEVAVKGIRATVYCRSGYTR